MVEKYSLSANRSIACYLTDYSYEKILSEGEQLIDNYILVYTTKELEHDSITGGFILALDSIVRNSYNDILYDGWDKIKDDLEHKVHNLKLDKPVAIKHYYIAPRFPCSISMTRFVNNLKEDVYITSTGFTEIENKFIAFSIYYKYEGEQTLNALGAKTDFFGILLLSFNKK